MDLILITQLANEAGWSAKSIDNDGSKVKLIFAKMIDGTVYYIGSTIYNDENDDISLSSICDSLSNHYDICKIEKLRPYIEKLFDAFNVYITTSSMRACCDDSLPNGNLYVITIDSDGSRKTAVFNTKAEAIENMTRLFESRMSYHDGYIQASQNNDGYAIDYMEGDDKEIATITEVIPNQFSDWFKIQ
jgi:hypothetical protein